MNKIKLSVGATLMLLAAGCVERRVYVPVYQAPPPGTAVVAQAPPGTVVVEQAPPAPPAEVVTVAPGPEYYWVPGYWSWQGRWVWMRGAWTVRPRPGAVWVGGYWAPHPRGRVWVGGHWR